VASRARIAKRFEGSLGRDAHKKKARQTGDAPSNKKRMATALLGLHCSQITPAKNRAVARFCVVAAHQHEIHPQFINKALWVSCGRFNGMRMLLLKQPTRLKSSSITA
jgi:hypothetical protein